MKTMKFGILGSGYIATKMAEAVKGLEKMGYGVEAYAVASRDLAKAQKFAEENGFVKAYGSYEDLANDKEVDLIYVATPHSHHFENAKMCIEHGKNLLVEKAFCGNAKQATVLIALAEEKGVFLQEAMWTRFLPAVKTIRQWIDAGRIGQVESVEADFSQPLTHVQRLVDPALAGGALLDLGIYSLMFADLFLGDDASGKDCAVSGIDSAVSGNENRGGGITHIDSKCVKYSSGVDASDWINITYQNGQKAYLKTSITSAWHNEGAIYGTKGSIRVENLNDMVKLEVFDSAGTLVESVTPERLVNCYEYEVLACKEALERGPRKVSSGTSCKTIWECPEMPHTKTFEMMDLMDGLRVNWGVSYPFEISPSATWDRSGDKSILQIYDVASESVRTLHEFDCVIEAPNWSSDGKFLTYNSNGRIYKLDLLQDAAGNITAGPITEVPSYYCDNCNNDHVLAPDGTGLYVSHHTKEDGLSRIYKIFFDGRMPELVTPLGPSYLHGITPDGKTLAYCAERNGEYDIYTIPAVGGNETRLTTAKGLNDGPEYDASGEYIWFNSVRTGRMQAFRMKADGSEQTQMTDDLHWNTWFPHISPDKKQVVMVCYTEEDVRPGEHVPNKNVEVRLMTRDNPAGKNDASEWSNPQTILKLFGGQGTINVNSWSPDSKQFAFVSYRKK